MYSPEPSTNLPTPNESSPLRINRAWHHSPRFWLLAGGAAIVITAVVISVLFSLYTFAVNGASNHSVRYASASDSTPERSVFSVFGLYFVPRQAAYIELSTNTSATRLTVDDKPLIGFARRDISIDPQRTVSKIGRDSLGCTIMNSSGNYTYECTDPGESVLLADLNAGRWHNTSYGYLPQDARANVPYKNGVLSLTVSGGLDPALAEAVKDTEAASVFEDFTPEVTAVYTAPGLAEDQWVSTRLEFDEGDTIGVAADTTGGDGFAVYNATKGKIRYFENLTSDTKTLARSSAYSNKGDITSCSLAGEILACYSGASSHTPDKDDAKSEQRKAIKERKNATGVIETYKVKEEGSTLSYVRTAPLDTICLSKQQELIGLSGDRVSRITPQTDATATARTIGSGATHIGCGDRALYATENGVYAVHNTAARLVFASDNLQIASLSGYGDKLLFNARVATHKDQPTDATVHTYKINIDTALSGKRLEDVLPYASLDEVLISDMDYNDTLIYVKPRFNVISDVNTGQATIDESSYHKAEVEVNAILERDGILDVGIPVVFSTD